MRKAKKPKGNKLLNSPFELPEKVELTAGLLMLLHAIAGPGR